LALAGRRRSRGRGARRKLTPVKRLEELANRAKQITMPIEHRLAEKPIPDRLVSMFDPDARPIRRGKLAKPNEFGYVLQVCEVTQNTERGACGFVLASG
jgi:transposase, IS5 family